MSVRETRAYIMRHAPIRNGTVDEMTVAATLTNDALFGRYVPRVQVRKSPLLVEPVRVKIVNDTFIVAFTAKATQYSLEEAILKAIVYDRFNDQTYATKERLFKCARNELLASKSELYVRVLDKIHELAR